MDDREDRNSEQLLTNFFSAAREEHSAPRDLWEQVSTGIERSAQGSSRTWSLPRAGDRRVAALAVAVALVAVFVFNPFSGENGTSPATDLLQRAHAAALDSGLVESVYTRIRVEDLVYENQTEPEGDPLVSEVFHREAWWTGPTMWRFDSSIEYFDSGEQMDPQPGWLKGGTTVADGTNVWTYSDIEPGEAEAPEDLSHPQTHVRTLNEYDELGAGSLFAFGGTWLTGQESQDLARLLGELEDCFDARMDRTAEVAGRETNVVRLQPRGIGDRVTGVLEAGSCMSLVQLESTDSGERIADQELTLWIDVEHFFILKMEQIVRYTQVDGEPVVSVSRSEVTELELNRAIPDERFEFTPPPGVPIVDER